MSLVLPVGGAAHGASHRLAISADDHRRRRGTVRQVTVEVFAIASTIGTNSHFAALVTGAGDVTGAAAWQHWRRPRR